MTEKPAFQGELVAADADARIFGTQNPGNDNGLGEDVDVFLSSEGASEVALLQDAGWVSTDAETFVPSQVVDIVATPPIGDTLVGVGYSATFGSFPVVSFFALGDFDPGGATVGCMCRDIDLHDRVWLIETSGDGIDSRFDASTFVLPGSADALTDWAATEVGDTTGDGASDLLVGADSGGGAFGFLVPSSASVDASFSGAVGYSSLQYNMVGQHIAAAGDTDGDGLSEYLAAGSNWDWESDHGYGGGGAAFLLQGLPEADIGDSVGLLATIEGEASGYQVGGPFGNVQGIGDNDDDGYADVLIGATAEPSEDNYWPSKYLTGIFHGPLNGIVRFTDAPVTLRADDEGDPVHCTDRAFGDFDGDGGIDLLASGYSGGYLFLGPIGASGFASDLAAASFAESRGGYSIGDFDADGFDDFVLTDPAWTGTGDDGLPLYGRVQLWYGR